MSKVGRISLTFVATAIGSFVGFSFGFAVVAVSCWLFASILPPRLADPLPVNLFTAACGFAGALLFGVYFYRISGERTAVHWRADQNRGFEMVTKNSRSSLKESR